MSGNNVGEGVGMVGTTEESIEGNVEREVDKEGDVITDENGENEDITEKDVTVTSHAPLLTVTD